MVYTFACTIALFIDDDWNIIEQVVDFKPLEDKEHEGVLGGMAFVNGAQQRGGLDKMSRHGLTFKQCHFYLLYSYIYFISLTSDNASVNNVIVETVARCLLARYNIPWTPDMHIRCIAHVINLIVQAFLYGMDEADDPDIVDNFDSNKDAPIHYNVDEDEDQIAMENEAMEDLASQADVPESVNPAEEAMLVEEIAGQSPIKHVSVPYMLDIIVLIVSRIIPCHLSCGLLPPKLYRPLNAVSNSRRSLTIYMPMTRQLNGWQRSWWCGIFEHGGIIHMP